MTLIQENILLLNLPYWDPLVPPQGIAHLKRFLQHHGYRAVTRDANTEDRFKTVYNKYFGLLRAHVPVEHHGNFFNIGHDVLRNHMIAHMHRTGSNEKKYRELVKMLVYTTFYTRFSDEQADALSELLSILYSRLEKYVLSLLSEVKPGTLGITVHRDTIGPAMFAFRAAKSKYPGLRTVMGGSVFADQLWPESPNFDDFLERAPYIDHLVIGEGQNILLQLLRGELPADRKVFTLADVGDKRLGFSPLNEPDMSDFEVSRLYPYVAAQASSSCPNQCSFCNVPTFYGEYKEKEPARAVEEMQGLYKTYGLQTFFMNDSLLNRVGTPLSEALLSSPTPLYWDGYLRVDDEICDPETPLLWRRGGYYRARLGVESGSQHVLDMIQKGITPAQTKRALNSLAEAGIKTTTYWVIGHPGETEEDFQQTLQLLEEARDSIFQAECNPFACGYMGQTATEAWKDKQKLLFPGEMSDLLFLKTWLVDVEPTREEMFNRVFRFVKRCNELGIPNPYSLHDIYKADKRWHRLHKNAVPPLTVFKDGSGPIDECRDIKKQVRMQVTIDDEGDFGF